MKRIILFIATVSAGIGTFAQENFGVNQSNPQAKTHITNGDNQPALRVDDQTGDTTPFIVDSTGNVGVKTATPTNSLDVNGTDAMGVPAGTSAERPTAAYVGDLRYNTTIGGMEYYDGTNWVSITPAGTIQMFGGVVANVPSGWLICDGSEVSRTDYPELFLKIGVAFGAGDGATTFNLPDLRGRFVRGTDNGAGNDPDAATRNFSNIGGNTGDNVGSLQDDAFEAHTHSESRHDNNPSSGQATSGGGTLGNAMEYPQTGSTGGSETRPKNVNLNFIIKY